MFQVTTLDLSMIGNLIDTANQAGANSVSGITFGLENPDPVKQQALTQAAKQATTTIPIVMNGVGDAIRAGFVTSLAHPGGNITGNTLLGPEVGVKRLQLFSRPQR